LYHITLPPPPSIFTFRPRRPPPPSTLFPYTTLFRSRRFDRRHPAARQRRLRCGENLQPAWRAAQPGDHQHLGRPHRDDVHHSRQDRKSTRLNSSHQIISYAVFCLKKKNTTMTLTTAP